ncbi:hypothetical protein [Planococcus sp. YIM B11945]
MEKKRTKKNRGWIWDLFEVLLEMGGYIVDILLFIPRIILRIGKDIN